MSAREDCYRLCSRIMDGAFSNLAKSGNEGAFAHEWTDKVIANRLLLEHILGHYIKKPLQKLDKEVRLTLMIGICELMYFDTPENVAVSESVNMVRKLKKSSAASLVNAVLRSFIRDGKSIPPVEGDKFRRFSVENSVPLELLKSVASDYGEDKAFLWGSNFNSVNHSVRVNTLKDEGKTYERMLKGEKTDDPIAFLNSFGDDFRKGAMEKGVIYPQGISSQLCALAVGARPGETVIDICAAPGGKSFTMAVEMKNKGRLISCDKTEKRCDLIKKGAQRLGLSVIEAKVNDGTVRNAGFPAADRVLCDVPCSGYGVIHNKPEIRYKPLSSFDTLPSVQYSILETSSEYVKSGGTLVYSTCTVRRCENEDIVERFLKEHPDFYGYDDIFDEKTLPSEDIPFTQAGVIERSHVIRAMEGSFMNTIFREGCDGFFIAVMRRK